MNIFVTSPCPKESATVLPDRHVNKMSLETCQMLSIVASKKWGHNYGTLPKTDGTPYKTEKGAFRNHPCTLWAAQSIDNAYWLIKWGMHLCDEYTLRYNKIHSCYNTLLQAYYLFPKGKIDEVTPFVRAMPEEWKYDDTIDTFTAYKMYVASKPWVKDNYLRLPNRKPEWV
jgi:hypothetical protein